MELINLMEIIYLTLFIIMRGLTGKNKEKIEN